MGVSWNKCVYKMILIFNKMYDIKWHVKLSVITAIDSFYSNIVKIQSLKKIENYIFSFGNVWNFRGLMFTQSKEVGLKGSWVGVNSKPCSRYVDY